MRKTQQDKPTAPKTRCQDKPRFIVTREYNGSQSMRAAFEQAIESQACGQFESWLEKRERDKREWTNGADYGKIRNMRRSKIEAGKQCPKCGKVENQVKMGYNRSGTQRCMCKECGTRYTIAPKTREYPEETRELAIKMYYSGVSGRGVGKVLGMSKANVYNWIKKRTDC